MAGEKVDWMVVWKVAMWVVQMGEKLASSKVAMKAEERVQSWAATTARRKAV